MIGRLIGRVLPGATDVVAVGLLRLGDAARRRIGARRTSVHGDRGEGSDPEAPRPIDDRLLELAVTAAALALAPIVASAILGSVARRIARRVV